MYYPANFDSVRHLPSLALLEEPTATKRLTQFPKVLSPIFSQGDSTTIAEIKIEAGTDLYGTGEVTGDLVRNGETITLWNKDNYAYGKDNGKKLYQSHPWVMGVRADGTAFGVLADNTYRQQIDLTSSIKFISDGPAFRVIVIERDSPKEVLKALGELTGTIEMPPLWALGYQQSRYSYFPDTRVQEIADTFRTKQIPIDVIWMDIDYMDGFRVFTFDKEGFKDPKALNQYLKSKDIKSVYMIDPGVKKDPGYAVYDSGTAGNHWVQTAQGAPFVGEVWPGDCVFPDFTRPETQRWWAGLYDDFLATGIDGVWNDMNEPAVFDGPDMSMPIDNIHRGGGVLPQDIHLRYHNVYGLLMVRSSREGILKNRPNTRPFILSRANFIGGHRYAATWTGDNASTWDHLKMSIPMSITLGLSGQPFNGPDIGGFSGEATEELLGHWMTVGAFYPFSRNHSAIDAPFQEPWVFGKEVEDASRKAINKRYQLMPFLYTLFQEAATTGLPVMRPVFLADPKDLKLRAEQEAFLWGDDLAIIPAWAESPQLPQGAWEVLPFNEVPDQYQPTLKVREGAVIPMGPVIQSTEDYQTDMLDLVVNLNAAGKATGRLYIDDGKSFDFKSGAYVHYEIQVVQTGPGNYTATVKKLGGALKQKPEFRVIVLDNGQRLPIAPKAIKWKYLD